MTFARESWPFVLPFVLLGAGLLILRHPMWAALTWILAFGLLLFFRDPARHFDGPDGVIVAAADGVVTRIDKVEDPTVGPGQYHRVVTFLSAFDVHIQRVPISGQVVASGLKRGRKVAAFRDDAGEVNESYLTVIRLDSPGGPLSDEVEATGASDTGNHSRNAAEKLIGIRQISGLMARRVVCYLEKGQTVTRGEHLGLIKFGSRVDLIIPLSYDIQVKKGQRMRNGETVVARPRS